ncbi:threonine/serine ThrE exporter family protein [Desertivirga xinjiangensis]|uniref:threonine/serine ThrE exporter family protein n=1 Tax=Desertivirga xinjiangensis TaxID=539206 RepID=UPI002108D5B5|nr:threonine/serine exporter family protein [Pedobacter xinjiangensis]
MKEKDKIDINALGATLLDVGALLMISGASTGRIRNTISRIAASFGCNADMLISQRTLMLNVHNGKDDRFFNSLKRTSVHGINFSVLSGISRMSWLIAEKNWTIAEVNLEVKRLAGLPHYPRAWVLILVGIAGAAFCRLAGGGLFDMFMVFLGSLLGLAVRQKAAKMRFNPYICVYFAALTSALIAGIPLKFGIGDAQEHAFATSVLFLIPGVPLINSFSDMIDGNLQNGLIRGLNGFMISFTIALGLFTVMFIYQF